MVRSESLYVIYNTLDMELVDRLVRSLMGKGLRVNYDLRLPESTDMRGEAMEKRMEIANVEHILILITRNSASSELFSWDVGFALEMVGRSERRKNIIPVVYGEEGLMKMWQQPFAEYQAVIWKDTVKGGFEDAINKIDVAVERFRNRDYSQNSQTIEPDVEFNFSGKNNFWILAGHSVEDIEIETFKKDIQVNSIEKLYKNTIVSEGPDYFDQLTQGDSVLGFLGGTRNIFFAEFTVSSRITATNEKDGPWVEMTLSRILDPVIPLESLGNELQQVLQVVKDYKTENGSLFPIDEATYHAILSSKTESETLAVHNYLPFYKTEGDFRNTDDQLEFANDIDSFASVIALKTVTPPLAIGLFGNWGSGKSFFMEKLSVRIEELTKPEYPDYVDNVVHVRFNSWHYSDTNLWASMITEIFESLHDFTTDRKYGPEAVKQIYQQLNITSQQLEATQKKIDEHAAKESELILQKQEIEKEIKEKKERLEGWKPKNYLNVALSDPTIQADFQKIKDQFKEEQLIDTIGQIREKADQFDSVWGKLVEALSLLKKMRKGNWKWIWILAFVLIAATIMVTIPKVKLFIDDYINIAIVYTGLFLTWLGNFIAKISPWYEKVRQFYLRIKSLKNTVEKEQENIKLKEQDDLARINQEISDLNAKKAELESEQQRIMQKKSSLEQELKEIGSGKRLSDFLATKTTDDLYQKQLGIISWIRKDFKKLNDLFRQQEKANEEDRKVPVDVKIDRIVLYIDDLDRCNEDVVVKVLEAIHLLLAFPLFVVIVGVDPRWLNNALTEKYRNLFGIATSYDYLEKIFQIPFALKPINKTGREKLIAALMEKEMKKPVQDGTTQNPYQGAEGQGKTIEPGSGDDARTEAQNDLQGPSKEVPLTMGQKQEQARLIKEKLEFTPEERAYMQKISTLFGRTPRSINRYINIYRIIKAHGSMKVVGDFSADEYVPIMFILGVIVGYSANAEEFITEIAKSDDKASFRDFIDKSALDQKLKDEINKISADVEGIVMKDFKRNLDLISRFSFRTLIKAL